MYSIYYENKSNVYLLILYLYHIGHYVGNNGPPSIMPSNGFHFPPSSSSIFWPLDFRNKTQPRMLRRAVFSDQQRKGLEVAFLKQKYISKPERKKLAQRLHLKDSQVNS